MSSRHARRGSVFVALLAALLPRGALADELRLELEQIVGVSVSEETQAGPAGGHGALARRASRAGLEVFVQASPDADAGADVDADAEVEVEVSGAVAGQQVFLDFDGGSPSFDVVLQNLDGTSRVITSLPSRVYSADERAAIEGLIAADVSPFGIVVSSSPPAEGPFSTLTFNAPLPIRLVAAAGGGFLVSGSFGDSDSVDHRNQNPADAAVIAAHLWQFFVLTDPSGASFQASSGLVVDAEHPLAARLSEAVVQQSANTAAHELGHLLGLRHHDGFGPVGSGLPSNGAPSPLSFVPAYAGPLAADATTSHLMSTGSTGATPRVRASANQQFSEREALKLLLPVLLAPATEAEAQSGTLEPVPAGGGAQALLVDASIAIAGEVDEYPFRGAGGDVWTVDLVSSVDPSFASPVHADLHLLLEQPDGSRQLIADNALIFEGNDPLLLDVELPSDGTYVLQVDAPDTTFIDSDGDGLRDDAISLEAVGLGELRTGDYEVLLYSFVR